MEKISEEKYINNIMKLFSNPNKDQLMEDMKIAKNIDIKTRNIYVNKFIEKYSKVQIDSKIAKQMIRDIISQLIKERKDFYVLMKIYLYISDSALAIDFLKKHHILNNKISKKLKMVIKSSKLKKKEIIIILKMELIFSVCIIKIIFIINLLKEFLVILN